MHLDSVGIGQREINQKIRIQLLCANLNPDPLGRDSIVPIREACYHFE